MTTHSIASLDFIVSQDMIDHNGHVNNTVYLSWMQQLANYHSDSCGAAAVVKNLGHTWFVRTHHIEYLKETFGGEHVVGRTWIEDAQGIRSLRQFEFMRQLDHQRLVVAKTEYIYMNRSNNKPIRIPAMVKACFEINGNEGQPIVD